MNGQPPFYPPHGMPPGPPPRGPPFPPGAMPMMAPPMGYPPPYGMPMPAPGMLPPGPLPGRPPFPLPSMGGALPPPVLPAEDPANWSEHAAADGRTYYHNKVTKVSTYDRPACLDKDKQQAAAAAKADGAGPGAAGAKKPPGPPALPPCKWKEYKTAEGKTYYSDGSKSLWEEPAELTEHKKKLAELEAAADKIEVVAVTKAEDRRPPPAETIELVDDDDERSGAGGAAGAVNGTAASGKGEGLAGVVAAAAVKEEPPDEPADAVAAFKQLLYEKGVSSTVKWGEVAKLLGKEALWGSLKTGEKKQAFAEYQTKRMKEEREERRLRARKAKDGFLKLLAETVEVDSKLRWRDAEELLKDDPRFKAPELSEHDKEDIFAEFVSELAKREKEEKALNKQAFLALLRQLAASGKVTRDMAWREAQALLGELPGAEEQRLLDLVDEVDRRHAFEDLQLELEAAHRERKRREKEERKRVEEERRKAFTARLQALAEEGLIDMDSRWKALKPTIETEEVYTSMVGQGGATPAELFDKFVDALQDRFAEDKRRLRDFLPRVSPVAPDWAYEDFVGRIEKALVDADGEKEEENKRLKEFREMLAGRPKHVKAAFKDLHARAVKDREEEARRKAKREERYRDLLLEYYWRSDHIGTAWEEAQKDLSRHSAYRDLDGEERQRLFDEHMASLEAKLQKKTKHRKELLKKEKGAKEEGGKASKKRKKSGKDDASSSSSSDSSSSSSSSDDSSSGSDSDSSAASDSPKKKKKGSKDKDKDGGGKKHARKASGDSSSSKRKRDGGAGDGDDGKDKAKKSSSRRDRSRSRSRSRGRSRSRSADRKSKKARARSGSRSD